MSDCIGTGCKADAMMKQIVDLRAERDALRKDIERLRVQLAGCSVIAGSNTKRSITQAMPSSDAYGYSAALADVERCVRREIDLRAERDDFYSDYRMKCDKETKALTVERDALRYDIERHVAICAEQAQEMDALAAQLAIAQNAEAMQRFDCRNLTEKVIPNLREQRDALAAQAKQYRAALRTVFFLDHNEMEWQSLGECQEWARLECVRIDAALAAKGKA